MTPERAAAIELELRRAAMDGPLDDRQRLIGLGLEALAGWQRARDLSSSTASLVERWRSDAHDLRRRIKALVAVVRNLGMDSRRRCDLIEELSDV